MEVNFSGRNNFSLFSIEEALRYGREQLKGRSTSARLDAELLLAKVLSCPKSFLYGHRDELLTPFQFSKFKTLIEKRRRGMPTAYLLRRREFYGINFFVTQDVLVPRPETEVLVSTALYIINEKLSVREPLVVDAGTGSGCIGIALLKELEKQGRRAEVIGVDNSAKALRTAKVNKRMHNCFSFNLICAFWLSFLRDSTVDLVVSNPPYLVKGRGVGYQAEIFFEPESALFADEDCGVSCHLSLFKDSFRVLRKGGYLLMEVGDREQAEILKEKFLSFSGKWEDFSIVNDLSCTPRVVVLKK